MAKTRTQFLAYVRYDFKRDDKDTEIIQAYNDTLRHVTGMAPFQGLKFQSWIPTVAGQEDYPLPSDRCHVLHPVRIIESAASTVGYPLNQMSKANWSERYPNPNATGSNISRRMPVDYCIFSASILVGPLPDLATYIIEIDWAKLAADQDEATDVHELNEEWDEVLKFGVLARMYESIGLTSEADRYWSLYRDDTLGYPHLADKETDQEDPMGTVRNNSL